MYSTNRPNFIRSLSAKRLFALVLASLALSFGAPRGVTHAFSGAAALTDTGHAVSFGERPPGSEAIAQLRAWIESQVKPLGGQFSEDAFTAQTPIGPIPMVNLILKFPGTSGKAIVLSGHYDTARFPMIHFVGANDGGSSTGFLIEFAHTISTMKHSDDIYIVFFDGEEAFVRWTDTDSLYGSRQLAAAWATDGTLSKIKALINIDMIGDKDLEVANDANSSQSLRAQVWKIADKLGDSKYFQQDDGGGIDDDHKPFVDAGVNAIDIITVSRNMGPGGRYWHTAQDTMDKLSAHSFQIVGDVVLQLVRELQQNPDR